MPAADHVAKLLEERVDLAALQVPVRVVDQAGVQAELAQQGQRAQDREPVGVHVADQAEDLLPLALQMGLVDLAVPRVQVDLEHLLLLGREVGGHEFLGAALDQRLDPPPELGEQLGLAVFLDRAGVVVAEPRRAGEQPRRGDRQQRPQLHEVVLHGRSGDGQLERGLQPPRALVDLRLVILGELGLVQDQPRPGQLRVGVEVDPQQRVRGDHRVGARDGLVERLAAAVAGLRYRDHVQSRREPRGLGRPVRHHARRGDDEKRRSGRAGLPGVADQRQGLQGLAQAHVVGEDPAELVLPQERQPREPVVLVGPQQRPQRGGRRRALDGAERQQSLDLPLPCAGLAGDHAEFGQLVPHPGLEPADPQLARRRVPQRPRLLDQPGQRPQLGLVQREVGAVVEQQVRLAPGERGEHVQERDLPPPGSRRDRR